MGGEALRARLERSLDVIDEAASAGTARLRDAMGIALERLGARERRALARLTVFAGGFDLEGAEAVLEDVLGHAAEIAPFIRALRD